MGPAALYSALATLVLSFHVIFIVWAVLGAFVTRGRPSLIALHIASLLWGVATNALPWPCPLTLLENWLDQRTGILPYQGGFLMHYLDKLVYPDLPPSLLTAAAAVALVVNLAYYGRLLWTKRQLAHRS
jgi:Protein of Unknown function (DUF2784)